MIKIRLELNNPYYNEEKFKSLCSIEKLVSKNKFVSFEVCRDPECIVKFDLHLFWRGRDHAGPEITLGLFGMTLMLGLFDRRHWDYEKNCWYS